MNQKKATTEKNIDILEREHINDGLNSFLFIEQDIANLTKDFFNLENVKDIQGPFDEKFIQHFEEIAVLCKKNHSTISIIGIISYEYLKKNEEKIYGHIFEKITDLKENFANFAENTYRKEIIQKTDVSCLLVILVIYDEKKDDIHFNEKTSCEFIEKSFLQRHGKFFLPKKIKEIYNTQLLYQKSLENKMLNVEIFETEKKLGNEKNIQKSLEKILQHSIRLTKADLGFFSVVGFDKKFKRIDKNTLTYFSVFSHSKSLNFSPFWRTIKTKSSHEYVSSTEKILNIKDIRQIEKKEDFFFDFYLEKCFKIKIKSILIVPIINQKTKEIIGIMELINKKKSLNIVIDYENFSSEKIKEFNEDEVIKIKNLSPFISVILQNSILYNEKDQLFNGFVSAAISAVEQRDPSTSGHSSRVALYTLELAKKCLEAGEKYKKYHLSQEQQKEIKYAALLHDFGKIGVNKNILIKSKKLEPQKLKNILRRIEILHLKKKLDFEKEKTTFLWENLELTTNEKKDWIDKKERKLEKELTHIKNYRILIIKANEPIALEESSEIALEEIKNTWIASDFSYEKLLSDEEYSMLKIKKGTLSDTERKEIESHVTFTYEFLKKIPWPNELNMVPEITLLHHEKLDGSGYPFGLSKNKIPAQTRLITVCDIFDALTATDRPYKHALSKEEALKILLEEADKEKIDKNLVNLFIKKKIYKIIKQRAT